MYRRRRFYSKK